MWKNIPKTEGLYQISNDGLARSVDRVVPNWPKGNRLIKGRAMKLGEANTGYLRFSVRGGKHVFVHRAVAMAFIPNPKNYDTVNHIDGNKLNNNHSNLEWCTKEYNHKHAWSAGLCDGQKRPVISHNEGGEGNWYPSMHSPVGCNPSLIHAAMNGRQRTHRGLVWEYA